MGSRETKMSYIITYIDHRGIEQKVQCSAFEDAEKIAKFLSEFCKSVSLTDGHFTWAYIK